MTRADRKYAVWRKTRLKFQQQIAAAGRPSARNYEALSKTRYNSVCISNFGLKFLQYILNILYFQIKKKKKKNYFFQPKLPDYYLNPIKKGARYTGALGYVLVIAANCHHVFDSWP